MYVSISDVTNIFYPLSIHGMYCFTCIVSQIVSHTYCLALKSDKKMNIHMHIMPSLIRIQSWYHNHNRQIIPQRQNLLALQVNAVHCTRNWTSVKASLEHLFKGSNHSHSSSCPSLIKPTAIQNNSVPLLKNLLVTKMHWDSPGLSLWTSA